MSKFFGSIFFILIATGCATYQSKVTPARIELVNGNCPKALSLFEELSVKPDGDQLVYLLDYATALQICGDYKKSSQIFIKADQLSEQVDYHSASRVVGATLLNEEMVQYKGDTFEKLFINAEAALNYLQLGETDDALVEVRRINEKYKKMNSDEKKTFELNSFSQYLSGLIWELDRKYDDACISYKSSYKLDSTYRSVALDMLRGCWLAKRIQEFDDLVKKVNPSDEEIKSVKQKNKDEVVILFLQGWGPRKAPRPENHYFPYLVPTASITQSLQAELILNSNNSVVSKATSSLIYNVEKAAIQTLNDDYKSLVARRIGSRVAKEVLADQVRQKDQALGAVAWLVMVASERADLRQWSTLPQTIQVIRMNAPVGDYKIKLTGLGSGSNTTEVFSDIDLVSVSGRKKIFLVRSLK